MPAQDLQFLDLEGSPVLVMDGELLDVMLEADRGGIQFRNGGKQTLDQGIRQVYGRQVERLVDRSKDKRAPVGKLNERFDKAAAQAAEDAYLEGLRAFDKKATLNAEDQIFVRQFVWEQRQHFTRWVRQVRGLEPMGNMKQDHRLQMYVGAMDGMFLTGATSRIPGSSFVSWVLSPNEHCFSCVDLAAQSPFRVSNLPAVPRDGTTVCKTRCKCSLHVHSTLGGLARKAIKQFVPPAIKRPASFLFR